MMNVLVDLVEAGMSVLASMQAFGSPFPFTAPPLHGGQDASHIHSVPKISNARSQLLAHNLHPHHTSHSFGILSPDSNAYAFALDLEEIEDTRLVNAQTIAQVPGVTGEADGESKVQQALSSIEEAVKPPPFELIQGDKNVSFVILSLGLLLLFWVSNYLVPDLIFRKVMFPEEGDDQNKTSTRDDIFGSITGPVVSSKATEDTGSSPGNLRKDPSKSNSSSGFGKTSKQNVKSRKGKAKV